MSEPQNQPNEQSPFEQLPQHVKDFLNRPAIYVFPTAEGSVKYGTNIPSINLHAALAYLHIAADLISQEIREEAEAEVQRKAKEVSLLLPQQGIIR